MSHYSACRTTIVAACLLVSAFAFASKWTAADFPLRVHIFERSTHSHYDYSHSLQTVDGEGRANLYENGEPRAFDFGYHCAVRLRDSIGYETYPARWKKPGRVLEILLPELGGKPGQMAACDLDVAMKDVAYVKQNGLVVEEPAAEFKAWMVKHQYDPEHGLDQPVNLKPQPAQAAPAQPASQQPTPTQ